MSPFEDRRNNPARRPTWAEIDLNNFAANFKRIKQRVSPAARVMAVVKANAYGHGAVECAKRLANEGADWFGVALPEEGIELRDCRNYATRALSGRFLARASSSSAFSSG